jgi:hypothetical protein
MNRAYVIEVKTKDDWHPVGVVIATTSEMRASKVKFADNTHESRWRRLNQDEANALLESGCEFRAKPSWDGTLDWS